MAPAFDESNRYIVSLNISEKKGVIKTPREEIELDELGIVNDAHAGKWHRQISMLAQEDVDAFSEKEANNREFKPGEFAENITTLGIDYKKVAILDRFKVGDVDMEVTQIGKKCHGDDCAIFVEVGKCVMPKAGIFTRVINGGKLKKGDKVEYIPRPLKIKIITLSDRASAGEYEDQSGPAIKNILNEHFENSRWHTEFHYSLIPDDKERLKAELQKGVDENIDILFTTGGTGIGPNDITPDVVEDFSDKLIPGIMDFIRLKYGGNLPSALISRSVAAVKGEMIIYSLPGSVKAVKEYTNEIIKSLVHTILMVHGLGH